MVIMKKASVAELKARLSEYLAGVKKGEELIVTEHGTPVARLTPLQSDLSRDARRAELIRAGLLRPGTGKLPPDFFERLPPPSPGLDAAQVIRDERDEGW